jgi:hypothetical protein
LWQSLPGKAKTPEIAARVEKCSSELSRIVCEFETVDAEDWAQRVFGILRSPAKNWNGHADDPCETGYMIQRSLSVTASGSRRSGKLDGAKRIVERMHCLGRLLVSQYPDRSAAHLAYLEAFSQSAKAGFQAHDLGTAKWNWKRSLDEARQALLYEPKDARAQKEVEVLELKLR